MIHAFFFRSSFHYNYVTSPCYYKEKGKNKYTGAQIFEEEKHGKGGFDLKRAVKCSAAVLSVICAGLLIFCAVLERSLPDEITAYKNEKIVFEDLSFNNYNTVYVNKQTKLSSTCAANTGISAVPDITSGEIDLFNMIPVKSVTVHETDRRYVIPCGTLFGIKFYAKGAAVIRCCDIDGGSGSVNPGKECGLHQGDTICAIDGFEIASYRDVERLTAQSGGEELTLRCIREGKEFETVIKPVLTQSGYRLGLWIRDSAAGLGTMTFYDPESGRFASLGHGICDNDTGELLCLDRAEITKVEIASITKGSEGITGSINGYFSEDPPMGSAKLNSECGLYGTLSDIPNGSAPIEIAGIHEVRTGGAQILCTLDDGAPELYDIEIVKVDYDENNKTKNLQIVASDPRLREKTGGIVQGMSGSPILQNGKLAGAVTHVLVTNSAKGYGIFAQNMFDELEKSEI